jgi:hypothetical protein
MIGYWDVFFCFETLDQIWTKLVGIQGNQVGICAIYMWIGWESMKPWVIWTVAFSIAAMTRGSSPG